MRGSERGATHMLGAGGNACELGGVGVRVRVSFGTLPGAAE